VEEDGTKMVEGVPGTPLPVLSSLSIASGGGWSVEMVSLRTAGGQ
jgi:hypothetical protein